MSKHLAQLTSELTSGTLQGTEYTEASTALASSKITYNNVLAWIATKTATIGGFFGKTLGNTLTNTDGVIDVTFASDGGTAETVSHGDHVHGTTGAVVGTTNTQTLTNKTLTTPTIASFANATHNHADAAGGGQIALAAATTGTLAVGRGGTGLTTFAANTIPVAATLDTITAQAVAASSVVGRRSTGNVTAISNANLISDLLGATGAATALSTLIGTLTEATPADADKFIFLDATDSTLKYVTGANLKTYLAG